MKQFIKVFLHRGALFCGLGPVIMAIVYIFLSASGVVETVAVSTLIREIFTSTLMAFIAAGISAVYTVDRLALPNNRTFYRYFHSGVRGDLVYHLQGYPKADFTVK